MELASNLPPRRAMLNQSLFIRLLCCLAIALVIGAALVEPQAAARAIDAARTFVTRYFTWYYALLATLALATCLWLAGGRYGRIVIGGAGARPAYGRFAWYSMLFACGQGVGLIFWSVAEPVMLLSGSPLAQADLGTRLGMAMSWSYFHWSIHAWAIYCVVAVALAYFGYNLGRPATFRDACRECLPRAFASSAAVLVESLAILATVLGLSTSFGFAAIQFISGLDTLLGAGNTPLLRAVVVLALTLLTAASVFVGVNKGMKLISEFNTMLSLVLMGAVFVMGPTVFILSLLLDSLGHYLPNLLRMGLWSETATQLGEVGDWRESWSGWWTVFIWSWTLSFSPFVGAFIARISHGRTLREFVLGVVLVPSLIVIVWISIMGGAALHQELTQGGAIGQAVSSDVSQGLFALIDGLGLAGFGKLLLSVATLLVATYFVTSLDSGVHALSGFASDSSKPSTAFRVLLTLAIGTVTLVLLTLGGEDALSTVQTAAILGALPFSLICLMLVVNFVRQLGREPRP
ncbi:BCCT family transporter [Crenobacter caeni]|uniref:BCCT family transporter n=1 Tax=Crenobacter caeni TaxID=2705474 RepID=A0A6B2KTR7_9NEIS|nr:BCCT family transporter [Crenobacter caeni]NDV13389.1 BCCT family transporter [Crenobacter caeni]